MSTSNYNHDEQRSCQCGERSGPAAEEQLVEDLKTDSWPCLPRICFVRKATSMSCFLSGPRSSGSSTAWCSEGGLAGGQGHHCPEGPLLRLQFAEGHAGEVPERLGYHCSPTSMATGGGRCQTFPFH